MSAPDVAKRCGNCGELGHDWCYTGGKHRNPPTVPWLDTLPPCIESARLREQLDRLAAVQRRAREYVAAWKAVQGDLSHSLGRGERLVSARVALVAAGEGKP